MIRQHLQLVDAEAFFVDVLAAGGVLQPRSITDKFRFTCCGKRVSPGFYPKRMEKVSDKRRIFCFFDSHSVVVLTHGFEKKSMKTPRQEIEKAETYRRDYLIQKGKKR